MSDAPFNPLDSHVPGAGPGGSAGEAFVAVITTIQEPTPSVHWLVRSLKQAGGRLIAVGDQKGPSRFDPAPDAPGLTEFYPLARQKELPYSLAALLPTKHYARKNLGYLLAMSQGAARIYETDDDNMPADGWRPFPLRVAAQPVAPRPWMNVYRLYSDELIWPRGFPLDRVTDAGTYQHDAETPMTELEAPIQQGLADLAPDVDAVWRLILDHEFRFRPAPSVVLGPGTWCPFNSQNTWWWPAAYPLMYLPSYCSFRMTDIWRSFVAQRCLWEFGAGAPGAAGVAGVVFHAADVIQQRNVHNLMRDFSDEVPGYLHNDQLVRTLSELKLSPGPAAVGENMAICYEALVNAKLFPHDEMPLVRAWLQDVAAAPTVPPPRP